MPRLSIILSLMLLHAFSSAASAQQPRVDAYGDALPAGAIHRLGTLRVSPDGPLALSPDGTLLATSSDRGVQFWDAVTGKFVRSWPNHPWSNLAFAPDGQSLATSAYALSHESWLRVYDVKSGKLKLTLDPKKGGPIAFSPDGKTLACGHWYSDLILYDFASGKVLHNLGLCKTTLCLAFSPDGRYVAAGCSVDSPKEPRFVGVWDCATGKRICLLGGVGRWDMGIAFQPDSRHLLVSTSELALYDITTGKRVRVVQKDGIRWLAADRLGKRAIAGSGEIWDLEKLTVLHRLKQPVYGTVVMSAGGTRAASAGPMRTWDVATGKGLFAPPGHGNAYLYAAFSGDDRHIVTLQNDERTVLVWDAKSGRPVDSIAPADTKRWGRYGPLRFIDGGRLVIGWELWDLAARKRTPTLFDFVPKDSIVWPFSKIEISPDGKTAVDWNDSDGMRLWDVQSCRVLHTLCGPVANQDPRSRYAFSPDSKTLAVAGGFQDEDRIQFRLVDVASGKTLRKMEPASERPGTPCFSSDGHWVFLNRQQQGVEVWHVDSGKRFRELAEGGVLPFFSPFAVAPHDQLLVTTGVEGLLLYEIATGEVVRTLPGHTDTVAVLSFAHDGRRFISGSRDNTALIWSLDLLASDALPTDDERLWRDLSAGAARAYPLLWRLARSPERAVALAEKRLQRDPDPAMVNRWIADLGNPSFARRSGATQKLQSLGMSAWPLIQAACQKPAALETRRRLEELLKTIRTQPQPNVVRDLRVLQLLEMIGTADAKRTLDRVEKSSPVGPRADAARSALARLAKRETVR